MATGDKQDTILGDPAFTPYPDPSIVPILPIPEAGALIPCAKCKRHIRAFTECPFCHADSVAAANKPPTRKAVDDALAAARSALVAVDRATAELADTRKRLCHVIVALEEASK